MAAASPRKPRRAKGRHRKPSEFHESKCARWLRVGAVGFGLAAAVASGQGVASAATDDSSSAGDSSSSADSSSSDDGPATKSASSKPSASDDNGDADGSDESTDEDEADADDESDEETVSDPQDDESDEPDLPAADPDDEAAPTAEVDAEDGPDVPSSGQNIETAPATTTTAPEQESAEVTVPVALAAPAVSAMAAPAPGTSEWYFQGTLQRAISRLFNWPGTPRNFVDVTNPSHLTDVNLDTANNQLDDLAVNAPFGSQARWLPDLISLVTFFFVPLPRPSTFTDKLNAMGDFLNRVVPPFKIEPGADTFAIITPYKIMGAAVVGTATVLQDMLNGIYDPQQWAIDVIKTTTGATVTRSDLSDFTSLSTKVAAAQAAALLGGDGGAFDEPERAWEVTLPTWTKEQVNPFTVVTYIALVGIYKRFQEMAVLTQFTTSTTYDSWHYATPGFGLYAAGTFHAVDPDGNPATFPAGGSLGATYTSEIGGATVTINTVEGGFTYTPWFQSAAFLHRSTSENPEDRYDTVKIPVKSADGVEYTLTFKIEIVGGTNSAPGSNYNQSNNNVDALGVVRGNVSGTDSDGDTLTYSLVGSSVNGLTGNSAYTKNGAGNGGIVTLGANGAFTYVSTSTAGASQSFQVQIKDGHGGTTIKTITVQNITSITPGNLNTSTPYVVTGSVPSSTNQPGVFTSYTLGAAPTKGSITSWNPSTGAFTYTSNVGRTTANDDVVTVIATDANGRTVTLSMAVKPTVTNVGPVGNGVATDGPVGAPTYNPLGGPRDEQHTTGTLLASDANGDPVTFAAGTYSTTQGGTIVVNANGTFTYDKNVFAPFGIHNSYWHDHAVDGDPGDLFTINVTDAFGATTAITYGIPIAKLNAVPTLAGTLNGSPTVSNLGVRRGSINGGSDGDGDSLTYSIVGASNGSAYTANGGIVTMTGTSFTYIPKVGVTSDSFQVQVNDGHGGIATATVTLTGLTTPSPQTNTNGAVGVTNGSLNVPAGDTGLGLTYSLGSGPSKGGVVVNANGTYTYTRTAGLGHTTTPNDTFTIRATDVTGKSVIIATINVSPLVSNSAPTVTVNGVSANGTTSTTTMSGPGSYNAGTFTQTLTGITIATNDSDGDSLFVNDKFDGSGNAIALAAGATISTANGGIVTVNSNGTLSYSIVKANVAYYHAAARIGASGTTTTDWFNVTVTDGYGGTSVVRVNVPVWAVNSSPTLSTNSPFCGFGTCTVTATTTDPDGDDLSGSLNTSNDGTGSPWYTLARGSVTTNVGNQHTFSWTGNSNGAGTQNTGIQTYTVYDGYYRVVNGVVDTTYPTRAWKTWNNNTTSTGN